MNNNRTILSTLLFLLVVVFSNAQEKEVVPPFNIKTASFIQNGQLTVPIFSLTDAFQLEFDDLFGSEANYYYELVHCDYDWRPSQLSKPEYLQGFDNQRIQDYTNSFNTLQIFSHYKLSFPNRFTQFLVSGNYMLKILNEDKDVVFSRRFILYEDLVSVPMQIKRARSMTAINYKHNVEFSVKSTTILFQNAIKNVKILLMQNGRFDNAITNIKPQYTIANDLIYKYDGETQFWAGNEFLFFENKDIRAANNNVGKIDSQGGVYSAYLYTNNARASVPYTFAPDINGGFLVKNIGAENNTIEADYAWVFFTLSAPAFYEKKDIFINGMFNNYAKTADFKMDYNAAKGVYEKAIMLKQGFTNYQYVVADKMGNIDNANAIDGNFYQTENNYFALVYYRENNQRYDRVIGRGAASSIDIIN